MASTAPSLQDHKDDLAMIIKFLDQDLTSADFPADALDPYSDQLETIIALLRKAEDYYRQEEAPGPLEVAR